MEKDKNVIESLESKLSSQSKDIESLNRKTELLESSKSSWEVEKDDLTSQIAVLAEEIEVHKANEEDLFDKLSERTNDLERLQESYVNIADRCNDAQDEIAELNDQISNLQGALQIQSGGFRNVPSTSTSTSIVAESKIAVATITTGSKESKPRGDSASKGIPSDKQKLSLPAVPVATSSAGNNSIPFHL